MNNLGELTTFSRLIKKEPVIMIPKVQRDYAYGRKEPKVEAILNTMLDTMLSAVKNGYTAVFDFVYGGSYVKERDESTGLIPLDGQQRLTTMFLLYLYASIIQSNVDENSDSFKNLIKFRYETRQTATNFCEALVGKIRDYLREGDRYSKHENIKNLIKGHPSYLPSYDSDPTIASMLNVLEVIEEKCKTYQIEGLWSKLVDEDNIQFYCLSLEEFGLTDDLYIKMNSRGKKLTEFEIFKSDLEKRINDIDSKLKDEFSRLIDNDWMDILWGYANLYGCEENKVEKADEGYMCLFNNIFRIELFRRKIEIKTNRKATLEEIISDQEAAEKIKSVFEVISNINKESADINKLNNGIVAHWNKYFYFSDDVVGKDDKIRLFWQQKQNRKPVFHLAMDRELSVPEIVYFYTLVRIRLLNINDENLIKKILRVVRNLVTANTRANSARYDMLRGFLDDVDSIIENKGIVEKKEKTFIATACDEEYHKAKSLSSAYNDLLKYENHEILQGSLMLFLEKYKEPKVLLDKLSHFEKIFDNNYKDRFDDIRIALIDPDDLSDPSKEYIQFDPSMANDQNMTRRLFVHNPNDFSQFLIKNERRLNQETILDKIGAITDKDSLKGPEEKRKEFKIKDWQYYYVKYANRGANISDTNYGCYAWDDKDNKPLEMVILNSSYHSPNNIEWKMLNHILITVLDDNSKYALDYKGSSPLVLLQSGITMDIYQDGWEIQCKKVELLQPLYQSSIYKITQKGEDKYLLNFLNDEKEMDYIELAQQFISDIEAHIPSFE